MTPIKTILAAAAIALSLTSVAHAQFGSLGGALKSATGGGSSAGGDLVGQQDTLVRSYVAANKDVLTANAKMLQALNMKDAAAQAQQTADAMTEGATKDSLDAADKAVASSTNAVAAELEKKPVLDANSKVLYAQGLGSLANGASKYAGLSKGVQSMSSGLSSNPMMVTKLQSAVSIVQNFPAAMTNVGQTLKKAIAFAQSSDVPVPKNAADALAALGS